MTTVEGNKIVAVFMGAIFKEHKIGAFSMGELYVFTSPPTEFSSVAWNDYALAYHSSWSWLMPVVEKIRDVEGMKTLENTIRFLISRISPTRQTMQFNSISDLWQAVVKYIQWYNQKQ